MDSDWRVSMFRIRQEQFKAFDQVAQENFHLRLAAYLREVMPEDTASYGDAALHHYIAASHTRAAARGVETEAGVAQWTCLALVLGPEFAETPDMRAYFDAPGLETEGKLEALVSGLNEGLHE